MKKSSWETNPDVAWKEGAEAMRRAIAAVVEKRRHPAEPWDYETQAFRLMTVTNHMLIDEILAAIRMVPVIHGDTAD